MPAGSDTRTSLVVLGLHGPEDLRAQVPDRALGLGARDLPLLAQRFDRRRAPPHHAFDELLSGVAVRGRDLRERPAGAELFAQRAFFDPEVVRGDGNQRTGTVL